MVRISSSACAELVAVPAGLGAERDAGDRGDHAGDAGDDRERGRARRDADRARGERGQRRPMTATTSRGSSMRVLIGRPFAPA